MFATTARVAGLSAAAGLAGYTAYDPTFRASLPSNIDGGLRYIRTVFNVAVTAADYEFNLILPFKKYKFDIFSENLDKEAFERYKATMRECNIRAARRLYKVCKSHGGIYNKFAQYVSSMNHALPKEAIEIIAPLQDKAKPMSAKEAETAIRHELLSIGIDFDQFFTEFDAEPIAAASLAQVHRAKIKIASPTNPNNIIDQEVAVKIQYPRLKRETDGDLATIKFLANALGFFFPQFEYTWLVPEYEGNILLELDFKQEASNGLRMKNMFKERADVYVPDVFTDYTTKNLLMMEFVRGWKVDKADISIENKILPSKVARTVSTVFGDMIHVHGFVHCDPHAGNLLVRRKEDNRSMFGNWKTMLSIGISFVSVPVCLSFGYFDAASAMALVAGANVLLQRFVFGNLSKRVHPDFGDNFQVIVLDHGMYRRLEPEFRRNYCALWKALLTRDDKLGREVVQKLGIGLSPDDYEAFSLSLTYRTPGSTFQTGGRMTRDQLMALREKYSKVSLQDVNDFLRKLPKDLLFVMRSTNLVRSLNKALGGSSQERFKVTGESAVRGLALSAVSHQPENLQLIDDLIHQYELEHQELLMNPPYRVNLPVESEILADKRQRWREWLEVQKLRFYVELIDTLAAAYMTYQAGIFRPRKDSRAKTFNDMFDPEVALDS